MTALWAKMIQIGLNLHVATSAFNGRRENDSEQIKLSVSLVALLLGADPLVARRPFGGVPPSERTIYYPF